MYDKLGRLISYTDADGGVTATGCDLLDRPVKPPDNVPSTGTYTYDHTAEPRGMARRPRTPSPCRRTRAVLSDKRVRRRSVRYTIMRSCP
ncbi:hypothetical protein GTW41_02450 [Streptomyces sp. SID4941]|nr:hypothetical protein [Streptomyces sp. SID4941]